MCGRANYSQESFGRRNRCPGYKKSDNLHAYKCQNNNSLTNNLQLSNSDKLNNCKYLQRHMSQLK